MKRITFSFFIILCSTFICSAEPIAALEAMAVKELGHGRAAAAKTYLAAAKAREKEASRLFQKKNADDLDFDIPDDDGLGIGIDTSSRDNDSEAIYYLATAVDFDYGGLPLVADEWFAKAKSVKGTGDDVMKKIEAEEKRIAAERDPTEPPDKAPVAKQPPEQKKITNSYEALQKFDIESIRKFNDGPYAYLWKMAIEEDESFKKFPRSEEETAAPKSFPWEAPPGAKGTAAKEPQPRTVVVGELDFDENDATACVEEALANGATTVIFENKGSPWYISSMRPRSNQKIILKNGVKILKDKVSRMNRDKTPLINVKDVRNVIIEGENGPDDVYIGGYESVAERESFTKEEGATGIYFSNARNVILRNVTVGYNACDGITFGGANGIWIENVVLKGNYRQAMSCCSCRNIYCRNVSFLDTAKGDPGCGIDFEPTYESEANSSMYFYDCTFANNDGGAVNFSSSSYLPVTAHFKRCKFGKQRGKVQFNIFARCGVYMEANVKAPSKIILEDLVMDGEPGFTPVQIENSNLFDVEIKNLKAPGAGPVAYSLKRDYAAFPFYDHEKNSGSLTIDPPAEVVFNDKVGTYSVYNAAGKTYLAPEEGQRGIERFKPEAYGPPEKTTADAKITSLPKNFFFIYSSTWYSGEIIYRAIYWDNAWKMKKILPGTSVGNLGISGHPVAYYARGGEGVFKLEAPANKVFKIYFEVPAADKPSVIKIHSGSGTLFNAEGKTVQTFERTESSQYLKCMPSSGKNEVWSIEFTSAAIFKFFAPFSGVIAESPDYLPRIRD